MFVASLKSRFLNVLKSLQNHFTPLKVVLLYHAVQAENTDNTFNNIAISLANFKDQIKHLKKHINIVSFEQLLQAKKDAVVLTFDDGYANNLLRVLPVVEAENVPITIFISSFFMDGKREFWWDELAFYVTQVSVQKNHSETEKREMYNSHSSKIMPLDQLEKASYIEELFLRENMQLPFREEFRPLSLQELKILCNHPLVTIGAHTHKHNRMALFGKEEQHQDVFDNIKWLEEISGSSPKLFAYPHGGKTAFNSISKSVVKELNFSHAFAAYSGRISANSDKFALPRIHVGNVKGEELIAKINKF